MDTVQREAFIILIGGQEEAGGRVSWVAAQFWRILKKRNAMDNSRRGLHSYLGAGAKTSLGLSELKH
jgi:hypothetical protein